MPKKLKEIEEKVHKRIKSKTMDSVLAFIGKKHPYLWGAVQPRNFNKSMLYVAVFKDLYSNGYNSLTKETKSWLKLSSNSMKHNVQALRLIMGEWGEKQLELGTSADWNAAARQIPLGSKVKDINLWADSSDFRMKGRRKVSKRSTDWSYKCNSPAQRYMLLMDGKMRPRHLWGGYSPKVYDSDFLKTQKSWMEKKVKGGVIVGDQHFKKAQAYLKKVKIHAPFARKKVKNDGKGKRVTTLTKDQVTYSNQVRLARHRIESPFGEIKSKWTSLAKPWFETKEQQDALVSFSVGVLAFEKKV